MSQPQITMDQTMDNTRMQNVDVLQQASRYIDKCLSRDNNAPTLLDQLSQNLSGGVMTSGLSDHDYPALLGLPQNISTKSQIKTLSKVPLPPEIMEHFNHMQCHCMMGLFTEINRAWLTIDSDIYVWTYEDGGDVAYYDGLNETIISVGLIKPRPGVFQSFIKYLLVLTTAIDIVVLGVTFTSHDGDSFDEIQLVSEPVFTVPTDGTIMTTVVGSCNGRLFFGSKDGCLYEITYQAESSWFGKRCKKVNHSTSKFAFLVPSFAYAAINEEDGIAQIVIDDSRFILYMLTEKGTIDVYDLGEDGNTLSRITSVSQNSLVQQSINAIKTVDGQNFHPIISISAVELYESSRITLVATTQSGVRLYFSTFTASQSNMTLPRPQTLSLIHVRLPPGFSATSHYRPRNIHLAHYRDRNSLMISSLNEKEMLWSIGSDLFPFNGCLMEGCTTVDLDGPVLAIAEVKYNANILLQPTQQIPPLIVRQHAEPPRKYVILTSQGAHILLKLRPVDILKQLLLDTRGQDSEALKAYFNLQVQEQACATTLILASLESPQNCEVADYATNAFFVFGGEPTVAQSNPMIQPQNMNTINTMNSMNMNQTTFGSPSMFMPNLMSTPMAPYQQQAQYSSPQNLQASNMTFSSPATQMFSANATFTSPGAGFQPGYAAPSMFDQNSPCMYSAKHNGIYLYLSRILRPVWNLRCVEKMTLDGKKFYLTSTLTSEDAGWILAHLNSLRVFLMKNTQISMINNATSMRQALNQTTQSQPTMSRVNYTIQDAQVEERQSLDALKSSVNHIAQVLGLWKILSEHQFHLLMDTLPENNQQILQNTCFKDLFLYGHDICSNLINTLISSYLGDNASVDSISSKLRDACPNLYRVEDAACSKANEILKAAKSVNNVDEKEEMLLSALALCKKVAPVVNVKEICEQFTALKSYHAVTELCVACAKKVDPENLGGHFYKNGERADQDGYQLYQRRMEIYAAVVAMLEAVHVQNCSVITNISGQSLSENNGNLIKQIIIDILTFQDELLNYAVFDWMLNKQMHGDLISITDPSLETYLVKVSQINASNINVMDVLWKYYESNNNHASAAKVLNGLASTSNNSVLLKDRLSYLARALMCMRSDKVGYAPYLGVFLRELEDKMDIAKVQLRILDAIVNLKGRHPDAEIAEAHLNSNLYEITQLYEDFAEKFELWECKLAIIDCAGYTDKMLIENIWSNILQNECDRGTSISNDAVIQILSKIKPLVRQYKTTSPCIPLEYLVHELELISAKLKADTSLVPVFFVSLEYPFDRLINTYNDEMITSLKENFWITEEHEFHYSEAIAALINAFIVNHDRYNHVEKRKLIAMSQDTVAGLLSNLYSKPNTDAIINVLRAIQAKLSRL